MSEKKTGCCGIIAGIFIVLLVLGLIFTGLEKLADLVHRQPIKEEKKEPHLTVPPPTFSQPLSSSERLNRANEALANKSKHLPYGEIDVAEFHLKEIKPDDKEYQEALCLLRKIAAWRKKLAKRKKKDSLAGLSPAEEAGIRLLAMQKKGLVDLQIGEPNTFLLVEPLAWKGMTHQDKRKLLNLAMTFCRGLRDKDNRNIEFVTLWDMTTHETLAVGYILSNRMEIKK